MISKNLFPLLLLSLAIGCKNSEQKAEQKRLVYPVTKKTDTVDTYFNTKVADLTVGWKMINLLKQVNG